MTSSPRRFAEDVDVVARLCRAKQRGDLEAIIEVLAPDVVWETGPQEITAQSRYAGHGGVREWFGAVAAHGIEATVEPEAFRPDPSGRVAVWGTVWAQTAAGEASARRFAAVFRVQDGAVDRACWFADAAAMLAEPESSRAAWARLNEDPYVQEATGSVIGRWADERALLQLEDGRVVEVPTPAHTIGRFDIGSPVLVSFDAAGATIGWYLPDERIGVDLRANPDGA